ncbi:MAG: Coenzyme F420 hydrogenase/dehydrogenase, beta subunit C-terminal domain [Candidatus Hodarchaeota archaeon]
MVDNYNFENISPEKLMKITYKATNNFQYRSLFKAKEDIIKHGKYTEKELNNILDSIFDAETARKYIIMELNGKEPLSVDEISEIIAFPKKNIIRDVLYLKEQGYLEEKVEYISAKNGTSEGQNKIYKYKVCETEDNFKVNYFDPVWIINDENICCHCGLCPSICPLDCIDLTSNSLHVDEESCIRCGLCFSVCPHSFSFEQIYNYFTQSNKNINFSTNFGLYQNIYSARTSIQQLEEKVQDGGVVTTLLYYLLDKKLVDAVLTIKHSKDFWKPEIKIIEDKNELYKTAGRIYAHTPILSKLYDIKEYEGIAIVALPCSIKAIKKGTLFPAKLPFFDNIKYKIGLFCVESFPYENISNLLNDKFNAEIDEIIKMKIYKGRLFVTFDSGEESSIPLKECDQYSYKYCHYCDDLTSELADISIGSIGSKLGWSTVITRNKVGEELLNGTIKQGLVEKKVLIDIKTYQAHIEKIAEQKREKCITVELHKIY